MDNMDKTIKRTCACGVDVLKATKVFGWFMLATNLIEFTYLLIKTKFGTDFSANFYQPLKLNESLESYAPQIIETMLLEAVGEIFLAFVLLLGSYLRFKPFVSVYLHFMGDKLLVLVGAVFGSFFLILIAAIAPEHLPLIFADTEISVVFVIFVGLFIFLYFIVLFYFGYVILKRLRAILAEEPRNCCCFA
ncbi:hypothetical protein M3Y97_00728100 [Aphelenchoides bicaudatus]|nr:hypothetical protein M3Y97_00728100 [Aphelenchoides bicaudatus]